MLLKLVNRCLTAFWIRQNRAKVCYETCRLQFALHSFLLICYNMWPVAGFIDKLKFISCPLTQYQTFSCTKRAIHILQKEIHVSYTTSFNLILLE